MPDTDRTGKKKHSGVSTWYPELDYDVVQPSIEEKFIASNVEESGVTAVDVHKAADAKGISWDDNKEFMNFSKNVTGKSKIDDMTSEERSNLIFAISEAPSAAESAKIFDQQGFTEKLYSIRDETQARIQEMYPDRDVRIEVIDEKGRDFKTQEAYQAKGASGTDFSLHQFGAAGDFQIFIDDVIQSGERGETELYQVLGNVAKGRGLFWGFGSDSGHVAHSRYVSGLLEEYPSLAKSDIAMDWYERKFNTAEMKYKPTMTVMDKILGSSNPDREYINSDITRKSIEKKITILADIGPDQDSYFFIGPHQAPPELAKTIEPKNPFSVFD